VRVVHRPTGDGDANTIATTGEYADSWFSQARGLMFRRSIPEDYALVFRFSETKSRDLHMVFVPFSIDAVWLIDGTVERTARLKPWIGLAKAQADTILELPAGAASHVNPGDTIEIVE